jgi:hypothetical protein
VFSHTSEVIRAEKVLKEAGWAIRVMGPPPEIQSGCDLVIEFPIIDELNVLKTLDQARLSPLEVVPVSGPLLKPVDLFQVKDFGRLSHGAGRQHEAHGGQGNPGHRQRLRGRLPGRALSGLGAGGPPLEAAPRPWDLGHTLCGYALELAFQEMERQCSS